MNEEKKKEFEDFREKHWGYFTGLSEEEIEFIWQWIDSELKQARADELRQLNVDDPYINNRIKELEK